MVKMLFRSLIAMILLWSVIFGLIVTMVRLPQPDAPLLYLTDFDHKDEYYVVLDIETGATRRFRRPPGFHGIQYYGEGAPPERRDISSPYDNSVRLALLYDHNAQHPDDVEQLYRVRDHNQLEPIVAGGNIYVGQQEFADNGRYVYVFEPSEHVDKYTLYTLYRYDIQSEELHVVADGMLSSGLNCQENWCKLISGIPHSEDRPQNLFVLDKNSGEMRVVETANEINIHLWWQENVLLYTTYHGDGNSVIHTYHIETDQHRTVAEFEGHRIAKIYGNDWLMLTAHSPQNDRIFDVYIVNDLASNPTTYPLDIQTSNGTWLPYMTAPDGAMLLLVQSPTDDWPSDLYIIQDVAARPAVDRLTSADFDAMMLRDPSLEENLGDTQLIRVIVSDDEWRYYTIHVPTRTITQLAAFSRDQSVVHTRLSMDKDWLAVSIQDSERYYLTLVPMDGSQQVRTWDIGTESYVCLLTWFGTDTTPPPACGLHFGMG